MDKGSKRKNNNTLKYVVIIFALIVVAFIAYLLLGNKNSSSSVSPATSTKNSPDNQPSSQSQTYVKNHVLITAVDLYAHDLSSGQSYLFGTDKGGNLTDNSSGYFTFSFSCNGGGTESVDSFQLSPSNFALLNVSPSLPVNLPCNNQSSSFTVDFTVPNETYVGILTVTENYNDYNGG